MSSAQVNLHQHSERSFLDGYARIEHIVNRAVELGQSHVAITDHGECNGHLAMAKAAQAAGVVPIFGMEGYWLTATDLHRAREPKTHLAPSHICLLAASDTGLRNLWALSSEAYSDPYFYYKPIATTDLLRKYAEGIYGSDGCLLTQLADYVDIGAEDRARQVLGTLLDIFGDRFYIELHTWQYVQDDTPERMALNARMRQLNQAKLRFATEMGVPVVVVNDSHHAYPEHWINKELVWAFNTSDNNDKLMAKLGEMAQKADHFMGDDELKFWMGKHGIAAEVVEEAIKNSQQIAQSCQVTITPTLDVPRMARSEHEDLLSLIDACEAGFKRYVIDAGLDQEPYYQRMEEELKLIAEKRFSGYFNMVRDYVVAYRNGSWSRFVKAGAQREPVLIGPGRGSVGGSLVAYLTGIDIIDPIKYGTKFSRFLSPGRKGLPDVDTDVPQSQRKEMLNYLNKRFGEQNVCAIGTLSRNGPKQTLRDLGRALGISKTPTGMNDLNSISEHIAALERMKDPNDPDEAELTWEELIDRKGGQLKPWKDKYPELFAAMEQMSGLVRHSGVHASGVLVSSMPLLGAVPMRRTKNKVITTQFDMWEIEELGGVKLDLLGIRHLDTLSHARKLIYERHGVWIDYDRSGLSVPAGARSVLALGDEHLRDPKIWEQIDQGQTTGIFQVETSTGTEAAIEFKPRSEVDVADLSAIVRPGVADAGLKDVYLRRRAGQEPVLYDHPLMERIVGPGWSTDTYGVLVYQEQLIEAVEQLASFTPDESDDLRKHVGKKQMDKLLALKTKFITGCLDNTEFVAQAGDTKTATKIAHRIWDSIEASGRYAFNWSHAVGYAIISTWEIWTKYYYPQEFLVALMATDSGSVNRYLREARRRNIAILPPDVNRSQRKFVIEGEAIRYGLDTVDGVGPAACRDILAARPFTSLEDYLARAKEGADKKVVSNLIRIGGFDTLASREYMLGRLERYRILADVAPKKLATLTEEEKDAIWADKRVRLAHKYAIEVPDFSDPAVVYSIEKELVGTHVTVDPMQRYLSALDACAIRDPIDMLKFAKDQTFIVGGQIAAVRTTTTKKGRTPGAEMAHITVSWNEADFRVVVWPETWARTKLLLTPGSPVACTVKKLSSGCCLETVERLDLLWQREGL